MNNLYTFDTAGLPFRAYLTRFFPQEFQWDSEFHIYLILENQLSAYFDSRTHTVCKNDLLIFKPFELYQLSLTAQDTCLLAVAIDGAFLNQVCPDLPQKLLIYHHLSEHTNTSLYHRICEKIAEIVRTTLQKKDNRQLWCQIAISSLLLILMEEITIIHPSDADEKSYKQKRIQGILEYIQNNYNHTITLSEISGYFGIQPPYFSTFFKKNFGINFIEFLNNYRIMRSLPDLCDTNQSILDIAINHGFGSSKIYSTLFKKIYHQSPSEYRKAKNETDTATDDQSLAGYFEFFQKYPTENKHRGTSHPESYTHKTLSLTPQAYPAYPHFPLKILSVGRASYCLRTDVQDQIRQARRELHVKYFRMRDIFSDNLFIYYEDAQGIPVYNWHSLDVIFDFLLSIDARPFLELGFMPEALASRKQYAGWYYHPNVSFPKSLKKWKTFIHQFITHLILRYGANEIRHWYFDFWTDANLNIKDGYWQSSQEEFFLLYHATYTALKNVQTDISFGTPSFSLPCGLEWYQKFFEYCKRNGIEPDFTSVHLYGVEDGTDADISGFFQYTMAPSKFEILPKNHTLENNIRILADCVRASGISSKAIIATDCNITFFPNDPYRDTCFLSTFVVYAYSKMLPYFYGAGFHTLSDLNEDHLSGSQPFHGGPGLMNIHGLKKASYNAYVLLNLLGPNILKTDDNYILTASDKGWQLLLFNMADIEKLYSESDIFMNLQSSRQAPVKADDAQEILVHLFLELDPGQYTVRKHIVNSANGSAYDIWQHMGAPQILNPDAVQYINSRSTPEMTLTAIDVISHMALDIVLPLHTVILLEIDKAPAQ